MIRDASRIRYLRIMNWPDVHSYKALGGVDEDQTGQYYRLLDSLVKAVAQVPSTGADSPLLGLELLAVGTTSALTGPSDSERSRYWRNILPACYHIRAHRPGLFRCGAYTIKSGAAFE